MYIVEKNFPIIAKENVKSRYDQIIMFYVYDYYILITGGCGFDELQSGDEVEFMTVYSHKAKKDSAIYVKKLRLVDLHVHVYFTLYY